ncbi:putative transcription factor interactor and regulator CCHC(Zn) family [Helianthus anomalus]
MSCTSPWDWSTDPQPDQDQTSAAAWARNMIPQPSISASQWALLSNQNQNIQNLLVARGEGYAATRKTRRDLLKKKFESFHFLENETLNDITTRYYHLMCEMYYFGVLASQQEIKLENKNEEEIRKAKRIAPPQNTKMYLSGFGPSASSSSIQQPKIQTAFVSNTSSSSFPQFNQSAYLPRSQPQPQAQPQPQVFTTQPQFDPSVNCGPAIQLGNGDQTRTAFYAETVKNVNDGESSGNDDSSGYSGSTDEDGSGVSDYSSESDVKEGMDFEADNLSNDVNEKSDLNKKADVTSEEMEKILTEDGSFLVKSETPSICSDCADMKLECAKLKRESETLAISKCEHDAIKQKLESYSNSRFVLDHIIDVQQLKGNVKGVGYKACPPPLRHNYTKMPDEEDMPRYEPSVPLDYEEVTTGLGFKPDNSSKGSSDNKEKSSCASNQSPPTIEDYDSSDDESDVSDQDESLDETKGVEIPIENHILCDPPTPTVQPVAKQVIDPVKDDKECVFAVKSNNVLYTLVGDAKIYSDNDFPIKNVNPSLIDKVFEDNTNKFLGKTIPGVIVTQCDPIPKAEIRKQFGKQKSPTKQQPIAFKGKQQQQRAPKPKAKVDSKGACYKKKTKDVKFVASKGTDKVETFENKSNTDFVQKVNILKRNSDNNYTQHTNGCEASTSGSTTSTSGRRSKSPKFVKRRTCFKCGKFGHIIKDCTNSPKPNFVERTPSEQGQSQRRPVSPKNDKCTIKEQETKQ